MRESFKQYVLRLVLAQALFFVPSVFSAQETYFQQEVNYTITVRLDDVHNSLQANESMLYTNNSPHELSEIWMHLWPNAYKDRNSALCKQLLDQKNENLYYAKEEERGYIDSLSFRVNGKKIKWRFHPEYNDVCKLILEEALKPGQSLEITTPFYVKLPSARFSRMGYMGQSYAITQWYPKPAVFDKEGWHPMPYLDQGEFYSEFGSFDVSITLPANYRLAATGDRQDAAEEEKWIDEIDQRTRQLILSGDSVKEGIKFPKSDSLFKTVRFRQSRVHDFAWFADKRYYVVHDEVVLPNSGRTVQTWTYFTGRSFKFWKNAIHYVNDAVLFYSRCLGDYPYNNVTAVDGTIMAGGGMEYPNITVISETGDSLTLDVTITHEVGHNWFYGILGSNERDHPFMDEGLNSYYEMRYTRSKYPRLTMASWMNQDSGFHWLGLNKKPFWKQHELMYFMAMRNHSDQPLDLPSQAFTPFNYGAIVYSKTSVIMDYLADYLGEEKFDLAMQQYYNSFRFKHPTPEDFYASVSSSSGMDMRAFAAYFINSNAHFDYKLKGVSRLESGAYSLKLKNKSGEPVPVSATAYKFGKPAGRVWSNGFEGKQHIEFPPLDADRFVVDGQKKLPELKRTNNTMKVKGLFKKLEPLSLRLGTGLEEEDKTQLNILPGAAYNYYNGAMLGLVLHNYSIYKKPFEFYLAPLYAFQSKSLAGIAEFNLNYYPAGPFRRISPGVILKTFAYDYFNNETYNQTNGTNLKKIYCNYYRIKPYLEFELNRKVPTSHWRQNLLLSSTLLFTDSLHYSASVQDGPKPVQVNSMVNGVDYSLRNNRYFNPFRLDLGLRQRSDMLKVYATFYQEITIKPRYSAELRLFAGAFLSGNNNLKSYYAFRSSGYSGYQDMLFDHNFIARNERTGFGFSQFAEEDGALKVWTPYGQSSTWLISANLKSPRIYKTPLKVFADVAVCDGQYLGNDKVLWDAGIDITLLKDIVDIYIPVFYSQDIADALELNGVAGLNSIRFTLNIHKFKPGKLLPSAID
ncbi:MAG TPA: M1 family metallopeptidase [Bacteroidia bacterium]|nr:M1 family metallopeptidase [Bacteroidia bacterium]